MSFKKCKKMSKGFSLLELLLSIAIISLIILMATRYFTTVRASQQVSAATQFVQGVRSAASAAASSGVAVSAASLCANKNIPSAYCLSDNSAIISPWEAGGTSSASDVASSAGTITVTVGGIPDLASCNNLYNAFSSEVKSGTTNPCTSTAFATLALPFNT